MLSRVDGSITEHRIGGCSFVKLLVGFNFGIAGLNFISPSHEIST
jgi:hypothetical protein